MTPLLKELKNTSKQNTTKIPGLGLIGLAALLYVVYLIWGAMAALYVLFAYFGLIVATVLIAVVFSIFLAIKFKQEEDKLFGTGSHKNRK